MHRAYSVSSDEQDAFHSTDTSDSPMTTDRCIRLDSSSLKDVLLSVKV